MAGYDFSDQDLVDKVFKLEHQLVAARFKHSTTQLENTASLRDVRRELARLKTEARSREAAQGLPKNSLIANLGAKSSGAAGDSADTAAKSGGFLQGIVDKISGND